MTFREVLSAMRRRWYVPLLVLLAGVLLLVLFARDGGAYTTKSVVTFLLPSATSLSLDNGSNDSSIITFARAVAADVNNGKEPARYSSDDAPYYGAGIRQGVLIDVPSDGNQWYANYTRAEIDVQIVGRTREWVEQQQSKIVDRILKASRAQQAGIVSTPKSYFNVAVVPLTLAISKVMPTRTAQVEAVAAMMLAILIMSAWGAVALDRRLLTLRQKVRIPRLSTAKVGDSIT